MVLYTELPVYRDTYQLILRIFEFTKESSKEYKYTLFAELYWRLLCIEIKHSGVYVLQQMFNLTDRVTEQQVRDNAAFQLFCGYGLIKKWHAPDHTKKDIIHWVTSSYWLKKASLKFNYLVLIGRSMWLVKQRYGQSGNYYIIGAGIEPLIGHTKHGGQLDRSRMKSDETTKSAGYALSYLIYSCNGPNLGKFKQPL